MDFRFTEEQDALRELAREILENEISPERLKESEARGEFLDREAWARLAESNLLGLAVPEAQGGMGMGFLELCILLVEVGRTVAPLPIVPTLVYGALRLRASAAMPSATNSSRAVRRRPSRRGSALGRPRRATRCRRADRDHRTPQPRSRRR